MLHYVKNGCGEVQSWRDPEDISEEMTRLKRRIGAAQECYAALEVARRSLVNYPDEDETQEVLDLLMGEAKERLSHISAACEQLHVLQKEMRDTVCLLLRM